MQIFRNWCKEKDSEFVAASKEKTKSCFLLQIYQIEREQQQQKSWNKTNEKPCMQRKIPTRKIKRNKEEKKTNHL